MGSRSKYLLIFLLAVLAPGHVRAARRLAILVGANTGWKGDRALRYAEADARQLSAVLAELGGFSSEGAVTILRTPTTERLRAELEAVKQRLGGYPGEETFFIFYYSGHADQQYLHLPGAPLSFEELYGHLRELPATVKLGILDACQSGSILTVKGGRPTSTFQVTVTDDMAVRGTVILTSSGADELSQEARAITGSFFTNHLVSGLRGAADGDGDRRVSLEEVYRYASTRTLLDTAITPAGAQRPAFRNELKGQGNLYLTHLEEPSAFLLFPSGGGRCFVTDADEHQLVTQFVPEQATGVRLAIAPGTYLLKCIRDGKYRVALLDVKARAQLEVSLLTFREAPLSEGVLKGDAPGDDEAEALGHKLVLQAEMIRTERPESLDLSVLLAAEALQRAPSLEAQQVLHRGLERLPRAGACVKHAASVLAVAWSPDGRQLATASMDRTVRIWDVETGKEQSRLAHAYPVMEVAWSPDGTALSTRQTQGEALLWELKSGRGLARETQDTPLRFISFDPTGTHLALVARWGNLSVLKPAQGKRILHVGDIGQPVRFSADGRFLASFDISGGAHIWEMATGREVFAVKPEASVPQASLLALSPDGRLLALASKNSPVVHVWDWVEGRQVGAARHEDAVTAVAFALDSTLLTASADKTVRVWEAAAGRELMRMRHDASLESMSLSPDGEWLVTARLGARSAIVWNLERGQEVARLPHQGPVNAVAWSPDGHWMATASADGTACLWGIAGAPVVRVPGWGRYTGMAFTPDSQSLVTATADEPTRVWEITTGRELAGFQSEGGANILALSPDGRLLAAAEGRVARVWEVASGKEVAHVQHEGFIHALAFSRDGKWLASAGHDHTARVWDAGTGSERARIEHESAVKAVAFSPDGGYLATGSEDRTARLWTLPTGQEFIRLEHPALSCEEASGGSRTFCKKSHVLGTVSKLESVIFNSQGRFLATVTLDGVVRVWDAVNGREILRLRHAHHIRSLAFSPDGEALAIASGEPEARIWNLATGRELFHVTQEEGVSFLQYSADGRSLVTMSGAGSLSVWDTETGRESARVLEDVNPEAVLLSPDGRYLATAEYENDRTRLSYSVYFWRTKDLIAQACGRLRRNLTQDEWRHYVGKEEPYRRTCTALP